MARPTLAQVRTFGEYATLFRWTLSFAKAPNAVPINPEAFNCLCESTDLPSKTVDKILIAIRGHKHYQPGIVAPNSTLTMNFVENIKNEGSSIFQAWQEAIWQYNLGYGVPYDDLFANIDITRLDNADQPVCVYHLMYCFLESYTLPRLDGTTSGPFMASMTVSFDDFYTTGTGYTSPFSET